jgi:putative nucleotidyltransferase with HDIG domain
MDLQKNNKLGLPGDNKKIKFFLKSERFQQIMIAVIIFFIIYSLVAFSIVPQKYNLFVNDVATVDILSPKDIIDEKATEELIKQSEKSVQDVYIPDKSVQQQAINKVDAFFNKVLEIKSLQDVDLKNKIEKLKLDSPIFLNDEDLSAALSAQDAELAVIRESIKENLNVIFSDNIANDENDIKAKKQDFLNSMSKLELSKELKDLGTNMGFALIKPNMIYDSKTTEERKEEERNKVKPVVIRKYQKIVGRGEVVNERQIELLKKLGLLEQQGEVDMSSFIGVGILLALLEGIVILYIYRFDRDILKSRNKLILICVLIIIELLLARFASIYNISGFVLPVAFMSMLVSILIRTRLAVVLNIALSSVVALMMGYSIDVFMVALIGGSVGAIVVSKMQQRNDLITAGVVVGIVSMLAILGTSLVNSTFNKTILIQSLMGLINGGLSSVFTIGLLPFCETTFKIVTPIKLLELSNPNQPLLRRLLFEAPGTYNHSIIVGNLAEAAAQAIGANPLLTRVGSYYHDIGKIKRPYFFKENQLTNENLHDKIAPSLSTLIITNHIKDGVELAKKYKLPDIIIDMIRQHHGTTLVKYFYAKAVNDSDNHNEVSEDQFRYEGPKPTTKESAIIMLADSVEAAVRSIPSPTKAGIEEMVKKIVKDKLEDNQFDECDITLKDLRKITEAFMNALNGIYHNRIEYPEIESNDKEAD